MRRMKKTITHTHACGRRERGGGDTVYFSVRDDINPTPEASPRRLLLIFYSLSCVCVSFCVKSEKWLQLRFGSLIIIIYS